jgi:hypothetical protein
MDAQIALLVRQYLKFQDTSVAKKALEASRKQVKFWRYEAKPAFPDNPTSLHQPQWLDKQKRGAFRHGFDKTGDLVLIDWLRPITIRKDTDHTEMLSISVFGIRHKAAVVRHVYHDEAGQPRRALNLYCYGGFDRRFVYKDGRVDTIITRYWDHDDLTAATPRIDSERMEEESIRYTKQGKVKGEVRSMS